MNALPTRAFVETRPRHTGVPSTLRFVLAWVILASLMAPLPPARAVTTDTGGAFPTGMEMQKRLDALGSDPLKAMAAAAEGRFKQGRWQEALRLCGDILGKDSANPVARGIRMAVHALGGEKAMAAKDLETLRCAQDSLFYPCFAEAVLAAQNNGFDAAERFMAQALGKAPRHPVLLYYTGSLHLAQNRLDEAQKAFQAAVDAQPGLAPALAGLGQVHLNRGQSGPAAAAYEKAVDSQPEVLLYRRQLIEIYKNSGKSQAAQRHTTQLLYYLPGIKESRLNQAFELLAQGAYGQALEAADKLIAVYRDSPDALYIRAAALIGLKREAEALTSLEAYLKQRWEMPQTHHYAGMGYLALGRLDEARRHLKTAVLMDPQQASRSFLPLTVIEQIQGDPEAALRGMGIARTQGEPAALIDFLAAHVFLSQGKEADFTKAIEGGAALIPDLPTEAAALRPPADAYRAFARKRNLLVIFFFNGWYGQAKELAAQLTALAPKDVFALYFGALAQTAHQNDAQALMAWQKLAETAPGMASVFLKIGEIHLRNNRTAEAEQNLLRAAALAPAGEAAHVALGRLYAGQRNWPAADSALRKALALNPKSLPALNALARTWLDAGRTEQALEWAEKAAEIGPEDVQALDTLGWLYVAKGEIAKGRQQLEAALQRAPSDPLVQYHLGAAVLRAGETEKARHLLQAAVAHPSAFPEKDQARRLLNQIALP